MRHVTLDGRRAAVHVEAPASATRPDVVLIHGAGFDHTAWRFQTRLFAGRGHRVFAPDLPGHGESEGPPLSSIEEMAEWLGNLAEKLGCGSTVLVGHSMGSYVALCRATSAPDSVHALVLLGTTDRMGVHPELLAAAAARDTHAIELMVGWMHTGSHRYGGHRSAGSWSAGSSRKTIERNLAALARDLTACSEFDPMDRAAALDCPTLVVSAAADKMTPASAAARLAAVIDGSEHVTLDGAGHMALSERSEDVNAAMIDYLSRVAVPST